MADSRRTVEALTSQYKDRLRGWKEVLIYVHSMAIWTESKDAPILVGGTTIIFLLIWLMNTSVLTSISILGIIISLADYTVPMICSSLFDPARWGQREEGIFDSVCSELANVSFGVTSLWVQWQEMKETKPKLYSFLLLSSLLMMAYVGNHINNLLLLYLVTLTIVLLPGLKHHGILQQVFQQLVTSAKGLVEKVTKVKTN